MFAHGDRFERLRARTVENAYSKKQVAADWSDPLSKVFEGGYLATGGSAEQGNETRVQSATTAQLVFRGGGPFDIRKGDRVREVREVDEGYEPVDDVVYAVTGPASRDKNPFTGRRLTTVFDLEEIRG